MMKPKYDWIIIGGGVSGISVAEILCRENKSVLLIEKNKLLASETSKEFHEWYTQELCILSRQIIYLH